MVTARYQLRRLPLANSPKPTRVRVLIADGQAIFREGVRSLLSDHDEFEVVGEASDGPESVERAKELRPDVIVMDLSMPVLDGIEATRRIREALPDVRVLMLTQYQDKEHFLSAIKAGAAGCLTRKAPGTELATALRIVNSGGYYLSAPAAKALMETYRRQSQEEPFDALTARQRQILKLVVEGHTSRTISNMVHCRLRTVENHRFGLMKKLGIRNQAQLLEYAVRKGLVPIGSPIGS